MENLKEGMIKIYWWCKINKNLSDLDLALTYLSEKTNFKFYYNDYRWVYVCNIRDYTCKEKYVWIDADLRYLNSSRITPDEFRGKYGTFNNDTFKQVTKL